MYCNCVRFIERMIKFIENTHRLINAFKKAEVIVITIIFLFIANICSHTKLREN